MIHGFRRVRTYDDLRRWLALLTPEQLSQRVSLAMSQADGDSPYPLCPVIGICLAGELESGTRGVTDWQHHEDQVVLFGDGHPFSADGDFSYEYVPGEDGGEGKWIGDRTGKELEA